MRIEIKAWIDGSVLFAHEAENNTMSATLRRAIMSGTDLRGANLRGANLMDADSIYANLRDADLRCANLRGAGLIRANLRGANLRDANLRHTNLSGTDLSGVIGLTLPTKEVEAARIMAVARKALETDAALDMSEYHSCDTTHCIAGWGIFLAGEEGAKLEKEYGPQIAGLMLLGVEAHSHFFDPQPEAKAWLESKLKPERGA